MVGGTVAYRAATPEPCCRYLQVTIPDPTGRIVARGRAPVRAIKAVNFRPAWAHRFSAKVVHSQSGNMIFVRDQEEPSPLGALAEATRVRGGKD
jgi:hypothetical protein